ncbi:MAG: hypothetical protein ACHQVK_00170 [Candidatus Paceibacterales bacterium]
MSRYRSSYSSGYRPRSIRHRQQKSQKKIIWNVILTVVVLYLIFFWGLPALIGGLSVFNRFKPSNTTAQNAPENATLAPPVLNIPYEATNSAQIRIPGYASPNIKVNIYLDDNLQTSVTSGDDGSFQSDPISLNLGTNSIYGKTADDKNRESLPSKPITITYSNDKPKLNISSPDDGTQIKGGDKKVTVSGQTDPDDSVTVNGQTVIVQSDGSFSISTGLNDGDNQIVIVSTNSVGNTTQVQRKVTYSSQ